MNSQALWMALVNYGMDGLTLTRRELVKELVKELADVTAGDAGMLAK